MKKKLDAYRGRLSEAQIAEGGNECGGKERAPSL
jgi:hypothetical protein